MTRWPDFFIAGAPKAGTTALHAALAVHPGIVLSRPKEPKYFLCAGSRPPRREQRGPGDLHSSREWMWRKRDYLRLWERVPRDRLCGESTPFYLHDQRAHRRIASVAPRAKFVVLLRDPVDRAYSNWMHLWSDGLETEPDFLAAVEAEEQRRAEGWAPFWRYRGLGRYGEQLDSLYRHFDRGQVLVLRYRDLVEQPDQTLVRVAEFLGLPDGPLQSVPADNTRPFRPDTPHARAVAGAMRLGARAGAYAPPRLWRGASKPLLAILHRHPAERPHLTTAQRRQVLAPLLPDLDLLEQLTGASFQDWRSDAGRGSFSSRRR